MLERFIHGGTRINNERGDIMILSLFLILAIVILFAGMTEVGRVMIAREQLQTAADAASLSAAGSGTHRQVEIKVITNRGSRLKCDKDGNCTCSPCGTVTRGPFKGDETDLIDKGEWRDYCVDPCTGCPGSDCWFELVSRNIMYDNKWMGTRLDSKGLNNAIKESEYYAKETLLWQFDKTRSIVSSMIEDKTLEQISQMLGNETLWVRNWLVAQKYPPTCDYNCDKYKDPITKEIKNAEAYSDCQLKTKICIREAIDGRELFDDKAEEAKGKLDRAIQRIQKMIATNNKPIDPSGQMTSTIRNEFFEINLPKHAKAAYIDDTRSETFDMDALKNPAKAAYYPSVAVYAVAHIKTLFPQWFGDNDWRTSVCSQSATSFRNVEDQIAETGYNRFHSGSDYNKKGRWDLIPKDICEDY